MNNQTRTSLVLLSLIIFILAVSIYLMSAQSLQERSLLEQEEGEWAAGYLLRSMLPKKVNLKGRYFEGDDDASVTLAFYANPTSSAAQRFIQEVFPMLREEYIDTGKLRFYPKYHLTFEDFEQRNEKFLYAAALSCFEELGDLSFFPFYLNSFRTNPSSALLTTAEAYGVSEPKMQDCMGGQPHTDLKDDLLETDSYGLEAVIPFTVIGIEGRDTTILRGVPSYRKLNKTLRRYLIQIGD